MKNKMNCLVMVSLLTAAPLAVAQAGEKPNPAYAVDSSGHFVMDPYGHCVRTSAWTPALALPECEGMAAKKAAPKAEPAPVAAPAPTPAPMPAVEKVSLSADATFDLNKAVIKPAGKAKLDELAARVKSLHQVQDITITGYTDSTGKAAYNMKLSVRRADAVKAYLVKQGLDPKHMTTKGMGETKPIASNKTAAGRAQNRRVEITITGEDQVMKK